MARRLATPIALWMLCLTLCCSKEETHAGPVPEASSVASAGSAASPPAASGTAANGTTTASATAPATTQGAAQGSARAGASSLPSAASASAVASASAAPSASQASAPPAKPVASRTSSPRYTIDFSAPGNCTTGNDCAATLHIEALGGYHVNAEYKFRFVPADAPGVTFGGGTPADFAMQGAKAGTMSLRFKASQPGTVTVSGTFKICVCTESECQPEQVAVSLAVPIG